MEFYRYELQQYAGISPHLELRTYELISETPKGYHIGIGTYKFKWVSKTSLKRYAYPTKEEALENYKKRTTRRLSIIKHHIILCKEGLLLAEKIKLA